MRTEFFPQRIRVQIFGAVRPFLDGFFQRVQSTRVSTIRGRKLMDSIFGEFGVKSIQSFVADASSLSGQEITPSHRLASAL